MEEGNDGDEWASRPPRACPTMELGGAISLPIEHLGDTTVRKKACCNSGSSGGSSGGSRGSRGSSRRRGRSGGSGGSGTKTSAS